MEKKVIAKFEVDSIESIEATLPRRKPAKLKIKARMDLYDVARLFSYASDDFTIDEINEVLARFDFKIIDLSKIPTS